MIEVYMDHQGTREDAIGRCIHQDLPWKMGNDGCERRNMLVATMKNDGLTMEHGD